MNEKQQHALALRETDVQGAIHRMGGDENFYISCLLMFLDDRTMEELNEAVSSKAWDDAFTAAHALKGLAGNLGLLPLMHVSGQLVIMIRGGRTKEVEDYISQVNSRYRDITSAIRENFSAENE